MIRKILTATLFIGSVSHLAAQDSTATEEKKFKVSGYVDAYYRYSLSNPKASAVPDGKSLYNNYTSFTNSHNSFELGMASVKLEHSMGKVGMVADLGFGKRAEEFSYNDENTLLAIKQAYVTYAPTDALKFTAGSFATHVGYELVDPNLNRNYSMSYMFSYGPFFHTGIKADYTFGKSGFMLGITNPTDLKSASFSRKFLIGQYSFAPVDALKFYINYQGGNADDQTKLRQFDAVILGTITDKFSIGYNGTVQSRKSKDDTGKYGEANSWWGSAAYINFDPISSLGFTLRTEYFSDKKDVLGFNSSIFTPTLSANIRVGGLTLIPEFRYEKASQDIYVKSKGASTNSTASVLFAAVYSF